MIAKVMAIQLLLLRIWKEGCLDFIQLIENQIFWACPIRRGVGMGRAIHSNLFCGGRQKRISAPIPQALAKIPAFYPEWFYMKLTPYEN